MRDRSSAVSGRLSDTFFLDFSTAYIRRMARPCECGFTLYELLITMVIVGIVISLGVPNLAEFRQNSRITNTANELLSSFQLARSEAARSKANITICASENPMSQTPACGGSFGAGWMIFVDLNGDIEVDGGAGDEILKVYPPIPDTIDIITNDDAVFFSFAPNGLGRGDVGGAPALQTARICDARGNTVASGGSSAARFFVATPLGRATIVRDVAQISTAGGCP
jgi:type IV fimbrial biogenesis protein FimT